jgi:hypothetical protein
MKKHEKIIEIVTYLKSQWFSMKDIESMTLIPLKEIKWILTHRKHKKTFDFDIDKACKNLRNFNKWKIIHLEEPWKILMTHFYYTEKRKFISSTFVQILLWINEKYQVYQLPKWLLLSYKTINHYRKEQWKI